MSDEQRVLINVRVKPAAQAEMKRLADAADLTLSDIARLAMAKGLPIVKKEMGL